MLSQGGREGWKGVVVGVVVDAPRGDEEGVEECKNVVLECLL